ncbi:hypothetical protein VSU19_00870 [Verrucomicrobiales bacterium BCK34]|nr:hypothetical protein [Verrucomicrobiales bacterium BCK34]
MKSFFFPVIIAIAALGLFLPVNAEAQSRFGFSRKIQQQQKMLRRQLYRPHIKVVRPRGADRRLDASGRHTYDFYVKRGWVSRIEIRSGLKVVKTIPVGHSRSGQGTFSLSSSDAAKIKRGFKLWAWQGQGGYQSLHGESISYSLN